MTSRKYHRDGLSIFMGFFDKLNDTTTEMIEMKLKDAIKLKEVPLVAGESYPPEEVLSEDGLY